MNILFRSNFRLHQRDMRVKLGGPRTVCTQRQVPEAACRMASSDSCGGIDLLFCVIIKCGSPLSIHLVAMNANAEVEEFC
jgi:hypothetical protein